MDDKKETLIYQHVGENIRKYRIELGITQEQLAMNVGLSRASVVNIEKGRQHPSLHLLFHIAECLQVGAHNLIPKELTLDLAVILDAGDMKDVPEKDLSKLSTFIQRYQ